MRKIHTNVKDRVERYVPSGSETYGPYGESLALSELCGLQFDFYFPVCSETTSHQKLGVVRMSSP